MRSASVAPDTIAAPARPATVARTTPFFAIFAVLLLLRIFVPASLLDEFVNYDRSGGTIFEKFHPAALALSLVFALVCAASVWSPRIRDPRVIKPSIWLIAGCVLTGAIQLYFGRTSGLAYLADSLMIGPLVALFMLALTDRERTNIGILIIAALVANDIVLILEYLTSSRLLPYAQAEPFFRPTALLNHPLANGLVNATAVVFVLALPLPIRMRLFLMLMFVGACFVSGARFATISSVIAAALGIWLLLHEDRRRLRISWHVVALVFIQLAIVLGVVVYVLFELGFAKRMFLLGFHDTSTQSRFTAFYILEVFPLRDLLVGAGPKSLAMVNAALGLRTIENPMVAIITQFGIVGCAIVLPLLLYFLFSLARCGNRLIFLTVVVFLITGSSNNTFASKGPTIAYIVALTMAVRRTKVADGEKASGYRSLKHGA